MYQTQLQVYTQIWGDKNVRQPYYNSAQYNAVLDIMPSCHVMSVTESLPSCLIFLCSIPKLFLLSLLIWLFCSTPGWLVVVGSLYSSLNHQNMYDSPKNISGTGLYSHTNHVQYLFVGFTNVFSNNNAARAYGGTVLTNSEPMLINTFVL